MSDGKSGAVCCVCSNVVCDQCLPPEPELLTTPHNTGRARARARLMAPAPLILNIHFTYLFTYIGKCDTDTFHTTAEEPGMVGGGSVMAR